MVVVGKCRISMTTRAGKNRVRIKLFMVCAHTCKRRVINSTYTVKKAFLF